MIAQERRERRHVQGESALLVAVRFSLGVAVAAGLCLALWHAVPHTLSVRTDIVGYPIFFDYDFNRYFDAFYITALAFPLLAIVAYDLVSRWGPLRRSVVPGPVLPLTDQCVAAEDSTAGSAGLPELTLILRLALVGAVVAVEVSAAQSARQRVVTVWGLGCGVLFVLTVLGTAWWLRPWLGGAGEDHEGGKPLSWAGAIARVNGVAALVVIPLAYFVSRSSSVYVSSTHQIAHYPWLPLWFVLAATAGVLGWRLRGLFSVRSGPDLRRFERETLVWVVGPVMLWLSAARLPESLGRFIGFDDAQNLAAPELVFHAGQFPWRDLFFIHGLLGDVLNGWVGQVVFVHSRWGSAAGLDALVYPITAVILYGFVAYFSRGGALLPLLFGVSVVLGAFLPVIDRFWPLPILLILLDLVIGRGTWGWCAALSGALVIESILTPETGLMALGVAATVVLFDLSHSTGWRPDRAQFVRTARCTVAGLAFTAAWIVFLAASGALGGFIRYYLIFGPGLALSGATPLSGPISVRLVVYLVLPIVAIVLTAWMVTAKVRRRRPWTSTEWVMVAAALWVVLYYRKGITRSGPGHLTEVFQVALPLILLWGISLLTTADRWARKRIRLSGMVRPIQTLRHPATCIAIGAAAFLTPLPLTSMWHVPGRLHAEVMAPPPSQAPMLGYTVAGSTDVTEIVDVEKVLATYAPGDEPVFDFANEPGILYYLLGRRPGTRFYHVSMAIPANAQQELVSELQKSRPPVVVFTDTSFGLPTWDGAINPVRHYDVSEYLLDHYAPFADIQGQLLLIRDDLAAHRPRLPVLAVPPRTTNLYFAGPSCNWGDVPNFLDPPSRSERQAAVTIPLRPMTNLVIRGWAVDAHSGRPAADVVAIVGGRMVASAVPAISRPDVAAARKQPSALRSGFSLSLPRGMQQVPTVYAIGADGTASLLSGATKSTSPDLVTAFRTPDGILHRVAEGAAEGFVDSGARSNTNVYTLQIPAHTKLAAYEWLVIDTARPFGANTFTIADRVPSDQGHQIGFQTLPRIGAEVAVRVGSCLAWHGYGTDGLTINSSQAFSPTRAYLLP